MGREHNGRPEILASALPAASISFVDGQHQSCGGPWNKQQARKGQCPVCRKPLTGGRPMILCPEGCGQWAYVRRGVLKPHPAPHLGHCPGRSSCEVVRQTRCPGSGQRITVDLTRDQHLALLYKIQHAADDRRRTRVHGVRPAPVLPPVGRFGLAAA